MYGMLKESAKVLQSGRQIAIQAELFAARQAGWELDGSWMGAGWERRSCNPIRRLQVVHHQSLARTPGQTRLDRRQFNLSARGEVGGGTQQPPAGGCSV